MATIDVKDAAGATVALEKPNGNGRQAAAGSRPVALSTEDLAALNAITAKLSADPATQTTLAAILSALGGTLTVAGTVNANLPAGLATSAKQDTLIAKDFATQTTLSAVLAALASVAVTGPLTDTQLRATAVPVSLSGVATSAKQDTQTAAVNLVGTRAYGAIERVASGAASAQSGAITATEVLLHASKRCYVLAGANPTASATTAIPLEAGEKFHMRITSGHKIAVIRDTEDGFLHIAAVA